MSVLKKLFGREKRDKKSALSVARPSPEQKTEDDLKEMRTILAKKQAKYGSGEKYREHLANRKTRFPDRTIEIETYREAARKYRGEGNYSKARAVYSGWIEFLKQQNINTDGQLKDEHEKAKQEFSEFVKTDPLYLKIRESVIEIIQLQPGILQTEIYKLLSQHKKSDVMYVLYFAADHNEIIRVKKGRTYTLRLPEKYSTT